ncbi:MAG: DUF1501 domain-containing protein [Chitinophagaceae bacterium]|nr:DUF1501 domain-containing protein [Anaerolineae bacterium]
MNTTSRRNFMQSLGAMGVVGLSKSLFPAWMPRLAFAPRLQVPPAGGRDTLVVIFQRGGMDGLNVVVPFGEGANYYDRRPTIAISEPGVGEGRAIDLDGFFGLHPALRPLKDVYDAGALSVIHGAGSPDPSRSHFDAMEYMERGTPGTKTSTTGWVNRHLETASWQNDSPFRAIGMGAMVQSALRGPVSALALQSIADFHLQGREEHLATIQRTLSSLYSIQAPTDLISSQASEVFATMQLLSQLNASEYVPANAAEYPDSDFGMGLKQIAQLIKAEVGLEVACIDIGGWDTHEEQGGADGQLAGLLDDFGRGMAAFYADLRESMGNVTVVSMSEFGRRVEENGSAGTDHGHGNCMFVMGGGVTGGTFSRWNGLSEDALDEGDLAVTTDYRDVLTEILIGRLGNTAVDQIFPNYTANLPGIIRAR